MIKSLIKHLPGVSQVVADRDRLIKEVASLKQQQQFPPGHYYSPIPDPTDVVGLSVRTGRRSVTEIAGIDLRWEHQESILKKVASFYSEMPFGDSKDEPRYCRYYFENGYYSFGDGIILHGLLRHLRPNQIIEVGSGFSSCLMLDVNQLFFDGQMKCTFIEPFPERLYENMRESDKSSATVLESKVQEVELEVFNSLAENDILFIDSSHVGKAASDVNYLFFEVLPRLKAGVLIHIHDIFYPFEYPEDWILGGRSWNEAYMLRCLLMHNKKFEIQCWGDALSIHRRSLVESLMPKCLLNPGAGLWLKCVS